LLLPLKSTTLPKGTQLSISFIYDANDSVVSVLWQCVSPSFLPPLANDLTNLMSLITTDLNTNQPNGKVTIEDVAPIVAFEPVLVRAAGVGGRVSFVSGAGQITYTTSADTPLTVLSEWPACTISKTTGENSNAFYGMLPPGANSTIKQSFGPMSWVSGKWVAP
jgi:hypothetical protein